MVHVNACGKYSEHAGWQRQWRHGHCNFILRGVVVIVVCVRLLPQLQALGGGARRWRCTRVVKMQSTCWISGVLSMLYDFLFSIWMLCACICVYACMQVCACGCVQAYIEHAKHRYNITFGTDSLLAFELNFSCAFCCCYFFFRSCCCTYWLNATGAAIWGDVSCWLLLLALLAFIYLLHMFLSMLKAKRGSVFMQHQHFSKLIAIWNCFVNATGAHLLWALSMCIRSFSR